MCGITGVFAYNMVGKMSMINLAAATRALASRGPDAFDVFHDERVGLGHQRLSIIDTSPAGNQPMWDEGRRYAITFNGEIFNFRALRRELEALGVTFRSQSDTEVLLKLFIREGDRCLTRLNGFFSFCIYDKEERSLFLARDRYGIKPMLYLADEDRFLFASEMKSILQYGIEKDIDYNALFTYLQLNYIPAPYSILRRVRKLLPGHFLRVANGQVTQRPYYTIPGPAGDTDEPVVSYAEAQQRLRDLLEAAVQRRLVADVPLGAFLSGGVDSSIITALAVRHKPDIQTFSIGYREDKFFDETAYATLVAKHLRTNHTVFSLGNTDLYSHLHEILNYTDEPFADSSAIAVYILSKHTRRHATVALSGDGADELLAGYNKHEAFLRALHPGAGEKFVQAASLLWRILPKSRNSSLSNKIRQLSRFAEGAGLPPRERYWRWATFVPEAHALGLLSTASRERINWQDYQEHKDAMLGDLTGRETMNDILRTDARLVLPNDMLMKVDLMSMASSLEVRVPFLDHTVVEFLFSLPASYKILPGFRKRLLQDAFRNILPAPLYRRPKKGFEVPLLGWLRGDMKARIADDLLSRQRIEDQGIFNYASIARLKRKLFSMNPGDIHARIWALIVFQSWWKKWMNN